MKRKNKVIILSTIILLILISMVFLSYGFYHTKVEGNETSKKAMLSSQMINVEFSDGAEELTSSGNDEHFYPGSTLTKTFTIKNTGNVEAKYSINLNDVVNDFERKEDLTYELKSGEDILASGAFPSSNICLIKKEILAKTESKTYVLTIKYLESTENQIEDNGKVISGKIYIDQNVKYIDTLSISGKSIQSNLPYPYQSVEYIESTGTQYIDTGVSPTQTLSFYCEFQNNNFLGESSGYGNVFGSRISSSFQEFQLTLFSGGSIGIGSRTSNIGFNTIDKHIISFDGSNIINVDGTSKVINTTSLSNNFPIILFGINQNGVVTQLQAGKIYRVKFGTLRDFIPAYNKETNEIGMYDTINDKFYKNAGTGTFIKGKDILPTTTNPVKVLSLGENSKNLFNIKTQFNKWRFVLSGNEYTTTYNYLLNSGVQCLSDGVTLEAGNYTLSFDMKISGSSNNLPYISIKNLTSNTVIKTITTPSLTPDVYSKFIIQFTLTETSNIAFRAHAYGSRDIIQTTTVKNIQLEKGLEATEYRPYNYIDIANSGKNLFDINKLLETTSQLYPFNSTYGNCKTILLKLKPNTYYTLSTNGIGNITGDSNDNRSLYFSTSNESSLNSANTACMNNRPITVKSDNDGNIRVTLFNERNNAMQYISKESWIMIEEGSKATEYEPYQETKTTMISLTGHEPLRCIDDVCDYIDYKNKKIVRNIGKHTFENATELTLINSYTSVAYASINKTNNDKNYGKTSTSNVISETHVINNDSSYNSINMINCFRSSSINTYYFGFPYGTILEEMQNSMLGRSYYYPLATPIEEPIDLPEIEAQPFTNNIKVCDNLICATKVESTFD